VYALKVLCLLRVGPSVGLPICTHLLVALVSGPNASSSLLHCSHRPVRAPDKIREQRQCTLGPLSYRNADVDLFETIF
jgi:hypothetical protein